MTVSSLWIFGGVLEKDACRFREGRDSDEKRIFFFFLKRDLSIEIRNNHNRSLFVKNNSFVIVILLEKMMFFNLMVFEVT